MKCGIFLALVSLMLTNRTHAADALLNEALNQRSVSAADLRGTIATKNSVLGGAEPQIEEKSYDIQKHPDQSFASYDELTKVIGKDAVLSSSKDGARRYTFTTHVIPDGASLPKGVQIEEGQDIEFQGDAVVDRDAAGRAYVRYLELHMRRAHGPMIGRVKKMDLAYEFEPTKTGTGFVSTKVKAEVSIRFMFFLRRRFVLESTFFPASGVALEHSTVR